MTIRDRIEQIRNETDPLANTNERIADVLLAIYEAQPTTLPASDVYPWAKQPQKPAYFSSEVGAEPSGSVSTHNVHEEAHPDIRQIIANGGNIKAVRSVSVNGKNMSMDTSGNVNIVIDDIPELKGVGEVVTELQDLNIFNRVKLLEQSNPDVKIGALLNEIQDGNRTNFTLDREFIPGTTQVWINGIRLTHGTGYTENGYSGINFIGYAPKPTTNVQILITERPSV